MGDAQLATKIDKDVKEAVKEVCDERGLKMNKFIEDALIDKLEEMEDLENLRTLRKDSVKSFRQTLKKLKSRGKL